MPFNSNDLVNQMTKNLLAFRLVSNERYKGKGDEKGCIKLNNPIKLNVKREYLCTREQFHGDCLF
ncbi:hypothetical protein GCM10007290_08510 [Providencia stuartii]|nr:hypothetical protein GCM10007290_08510 [Providencia thailandensis]